MRACVCVRAVRAVCVRAVCVCVCVCVCMHTLLERMVRGFLSAQ